MSVMPQNLRNAADYMQKVSGVDPTWLREAADEMERLRSIAAERMALFHQAATKVEQLSEQLEYARRTIRDIGVFCSGEDTTLGAIKRLTHIQNTAQQFCAKTDD